MGNIAATPYGILSRHRLKWACSRWSKTMLDPAPSHLLTIGLQSPLNDIEAHRWNDRNAPQFEKALREVIKLIDRKLYGKSHARVPVSGKYPFVAVIERHSAMGFELFGHFHIVLSLSPHHVEKLMKKWEPAIEPGIERLLRRFGFSPNIDLRTADVGALSYAMKNCWQETTLPHNRETLLPRAL